MANISSRTILNFYDDEPKELAILEMLNKLTTKRNKANKIKDILIEYFYQNYNETFTQIEKEIIEELNEERQVIERTVSIKTSKQTKTTIPQEKITNNNIDNEILKSAKDTIADFSWEEN